MCENYCNVQILQLGPDNNEGFFPFKASFFFPHRLHSIHHNFLYVEIFSQGRIRVAVILHFSKISGADDLLWLIQPLLCQSLCPVAIFFPLKAQQGCKDCSRDWLTAPLQLE